MSKLLVTAAITIISVWSSPAADAVPQPAPLAAADPAGVRATAPAHDGWSVAGAPTASTIDHPAVSFWPEITVIGASPDEQAAVSLAVGRFRDAGLALPDMTIEFHDDMADCGGHFGLFQAQYSPWRILVCSEAAFVVTHEMAHAWEAATLDDDEREHYVDHRGLATWDSGDTEWGERGVEDAAFHIQQNLMPRHVDLASDEWQERTDAYTLLTGKRSPMFDVDGRDDAAATAVGVSSI